MDERLSDIYQAVLNWNWKFIDKFVKDGGDINGRLISTGSHAGFTALHLATINILNWKTKNVRRLITKYGANVNCASDDGTQPIHLAFMFRNRRVIKIFLEFGANIDTEFTKEICQFGFRHLLKWCKDFDKFTILACTVLESDEKTALLLLKCNANFAIKDVNNKTLLMYALQNEFNDLPSMLVHYMKDNQVLNVRDNDGLHAFHYLVHYDKSEESRYEKEFCPIHGQLTYQLIHAGADYNATVNGNPDTLLINMAAYKCSFPVLRRILSLDVPMSKEAKPLHYFMLPVDPEEYARISNKFIKLRKKCLTFILENFVLRQTLGLFVPDEEIELMNQLVGTDPKVKHIVNDFHKNYIDKGIRKDELCFGGKIMTTYDIAIKVFDKKSFKLLMKNEKFVEEYQDSAPITSDDDFKLHKIMHGKVTRAYKRRELMKKIERISSLRKFIPLPYEIILIIIEYLSNGSLEKFVNAFYQDCIVDN